MTQPDPVAAARTFVRSHARILDQRRAETIFDGASPEPVVTAVLAYRNPDGGFRHGLEPDTRDPGSQPLYAQIALEAVTSAGTRLPDDVATALCDNLTAVAGTDVGLPIMVPSFSRHPRASHWHGVDRFPTGPGPSVSPTTCSARSAPPRCTRPTPTTPATASRRSPSPRRPTAGGAAGSTTT